MKVGDIVRQSVNNGLITITGKLAENSKRGEMFGTVIGIEEGMWPKDWEIQEHHKMWEMRIGRRVDVLWSNGKVSYNFAENALEVVIEDQELI